VKKPEIDFNFRVWAEAVKIEYHNGNP